MNYVWDNFFSLTAIAIFSALIAAWAAWKSRRADGRDFVNDVMTDIGGGSFFGSFVHKIAGIFWALLSGGCFLLCIFALTQCSSLKERSNKIEIRPSESVNNKNYSNQTQANIEVPIVKKSPDPELQKDEPKVQEISSVPKENISSKEAEKIYDGDDPIVRERLGLPPKN